MAAPGDCAAPALPIAEALPTPLSPLRRTRARGRIRGRLALLGPSFVAAVAAVAYDTLFA
jgi:hypothetical protein